MLNPRSNVTEGGSVTAEAIDCSKCKKAVPSGIFFCPYCGSVILQNMLLKNSSTAHYDPAAINLRPWKDPPPLKPPVLKDHTTSGKSKKKKVTDDNDEKPGWTPVMKQAQSQKKKKKAKAQQKEVAVLPIEPPAAVEVLSSDVIIIDGQPYMRLQPVNANAIGGKTGSKTQEAIPAEAVRGGGPVSSRSHPSDAPPHTHTHTHEGHHDDHSVGSESHVGSMETGISRLIWHDFVHPLAIYEADWLSSDDVQVSIHVSLLERKLGAKSQFWLRVGTVKTTRVRTKSRAGRSRGRSRGSDRGATSPGDEDRADEDEEEEEEEEEESDLEVLAILSNDVGRLLTPLRKDWVHLDALNYLQTILSHIANRVGPSAPMRSLIEDRKYAPQYCIVKASKKGAGKRASRMVRLEMREEEFSVKSLANLSHGRRGDHVDHAHSALQEHSASVVSIESGTESMGSAANKSSLAHGSVSEIDISRGGGNSANSSPKMRSPQSVERHLDSEFAFDATVAQITSRIPLGKHIGGSRITTAARLYVVYHSQDPLLELPLEADLSDDAGSSKSPTVVRARSERRIGNLALSEVEDPTEENDPVHASGGPNRAVIKNLSRFPTLYATKPTHLKLLLTPMYTNTHVGQSLIVFDIETIPYLIGSIDVNEKLAEGPKGAFSLLRSLCGVLRYEYTTRGVKAVVIGASALPEYLYIPGDPPDEDEYSDDDSHAHSVLHDEAMEALNAAKRKAEEDEQEVIRALEAAREAKESERRQDAEEERLSQERKRKFTASVKVQCLVRRYISRVRVQKRRAEYMASHEHATATTTDDAGNEAEQQEDERLLCVTKVVKGTEVTITGEFLSVSFPASRPNTSQVDRRGSTSTVGGEEQEGGSAGAATAGGAEAGSGGSYVRLKLQIVDKVEQLTANLTVGANALQKRVRKVFIEHPDVFSPIGGAENAYGEGESKGDGHTGERDDASLLSEIPFNNNLQRLVFESVCDNLDLFLSRQNKIMTVKYNAEG